MNYEPYIVTIKLNANNDDGFEEIDLKPSFRTGKVISRMSGGYMGAVEKIMALDHDAITTILNLAMGNVGAPKDELHDRVFKTGYTTLAADLVKFIRSLIVGGKDPDKEEEKKDAEPGK